MKYRPFIFCHCITDFKRDDWKQVSHSPLAVMHGLTLWIFNFWTNDVVSKVFKIKLSFGWPPYAKLDRSGSTLSNSRKTKKIVIVNMAQPALHLCTFSAHDNTENGAKNQKQQKPMSNENVHDRKNDRRLLGSMKSIWQNTMS